eukprot:3029449-Alexandrium_andersonii.AAC.1
MCGPTPTSAAATAMAASASRCSAPASSPSAAPSSGHGPAMLLRSRGPQCLRYIGRGLRRRQRRRPRPAALRRRAQGVDGSRPAGRANSPRQQGRSSEGARAPGGWGTARA